MSGIVGTYYLDGQPIARDGLDRMLSALSYRGPDGLARWSEERIALGHLMRYTTAEARYEQLPLVHPSGHTVLTADARLDNREALLRVLRPAPADGAPVTDGQLILEAYMKWGPACPEQLLGDFAFAIWDARAQHLFCASDHFGIKPFFYHHRPGKLFAFASEIKGLLALDAVPDSVNPYRVADFLMVPVHHDHTQTYYEEVYCLAPGECMTVSATGMEKRRFWEPGLYPTIELPSDDAYAEALQERFVNAVRRRMRSDAPIGSMLSGGLDSSSIVGAAAQIMKQEQRPGPLHTFSAVFDGVEQCNENPYIDAVLGHYPELQPHYFHGDNTSPLSNLDYLLSHLNSPIPGGNLYINLNLYRMARAQGVRVLFEGFDGDNVVSHGVGYFRELKANRQWLELTLEVKAFAESLGEPWRPAVWSWLKGPVKTRLGIVAAKRLAKRVLGRPPAEAGTARPARALRNLNPAFHEVIRGWVQEKEERPNTEKEHHLSLLTQPILPQSIREVLEPLSADLGLEIRFPFFDKDLVEYCLALPPQQKIRRGWSRLVMRRAMKGVIPDPVRWRRAKSDYEPTFERGLFTFERDRLEALAAGRLGDVGQYVNQQVLTKATNQYLARQPIGLNERVLIWKALSLALWLQYSGPQRTSSNHNPKEVMPVTTSS